MGRWILFLWCSQPPLHTFGIPNVYMDVFQGTTNEFKQTNIFQQCSILFHKMGLLSHNIVWTLRTLLCPALVLIRNGMYRRLWVNFLSLHATILPFRTKGAHAMTSNLKFFNGGGRKRMKGNEEDNGGCEVLRNSYNGNSLRSHNRNSSSPGNKMEVPFEKRK